MKPIKWMIMALVPALLVMTVACGADKDGGKVVVKEPGKTITVIDDAGKAAGDPDVSVEKIDRYEKVEISGWLDEETVVVSKENEALGKMSLAELADSYPRSLYMLNLSAQQYELLEEQKNTFLGEAALSADKQHLLYSHYTLGDPAYYVMDLDTRSSFGITGAEIAGAMSAKWADDGTVIGAAYSGGAYSATVDGHISVVEQLKEEALVIVAKMKDKVYYTTNADETLMALSLSTGEKKSTNLNHVYGVYPSPDGNQLLVMQYNGSRISLILCDEDGENSRTIAEGTEIGGVSWSPDQRMIAYHAKTDVNGTTVKGLYLYDMLTNESAQIAVNIENATTSWSPSGNKLVYAEWSGSHYTSSIVHLKYSLLK